jgi:hypothetical protein
VAHAAREVYRTEHAGLRLDLEARNLRHTDVKPSDDGAAWRVQQMLVDPEAHNDWVAEVDVNLVASRELGEPVLKLLGVGSQGPHGFRRRRLRKGAAIRGLYRLVLRTPATTNAVPREPTCARLRGRTTWRH